MPSAEERKCCGKKQCVTSFHTFRKVCLDRGILEVCAKTQADHFAEDFEFSTSSEKRHIDSLSCGNMANWEMEIDA